MQDFSIIIQQEMRDPGLTKREVPDDCDAEVSLQMSQLSEFRRTM